VGGEYSRGSGVRKVIHAIWREIQLDLN